MRLIQKPSIKNTAKGSILLFLALATGCSFKANTGTQSITIALPGQAAQKNQPIGKKQLKKARRISGPHQRNSNITPTQFSDFNCYAVSITGPNIAAPSGVHCSGSQVIGMVAGFVDSSATSITVQNVPNSETVNVVLFGVESTVGCPDLNQIFASGNNGAFNNMSGAYELAPVQQVSINGDTSVSFEANFDPNNPVPVFNGCGIGSQGATYAPTAAYAGSLSVASSSTGGPYDVFTTPPSSAAGAGEINGTAFSITSLPTQNGASQPALNSGVDNPVSLSGGTPARSVIQFQWDASALDLADFPYGQFNLEVRGGQADSCMSSSLYSASAAVYSPAANNGSGGWIGLGTTENTEDGGAQWSSNGWLSVPLSNLLVTKSNGKQYIVVNVESNYEGSATCNSDVRVGVASLQLGKTPAGALGSGNNNQFQVSAISPFFSNAGQNTAIVEQGNSVLLAPSGGTPPYTFTVSGEAASDSLDSSAGIFKAGAGGTTPRTATITVTDSTSPTPNQTTVPVSVQASSAVMGLTTQVIGSTTAPNADGSYPAGDCVEFQVSTLGFNGTQPTYSGAATQSFGLNYSTSGGGGSLSLFSDACSTSTSSVTFNSGSSTSVPVYASLTQAQAMEINANIANITSSGNFSTSMLGLDLGLNVEAGAFMAIAIVVPNQMASNFQTPITLNECIPVYFEAVDSYNNEAVNNTGAAVSTPTLPSGFYTSNTCATAATSASIPAGGSTSNQLYFKQITGSGAVTFNGPAVTNGIYFYPYSNSSTNGLYIAPSGDPVGFQFSAGAADASGCTEITVTTVDSLGTTTAVPTSNFLMLAFDLPGSGGYATQSECDTQSGSPTGTFQINGPSSSVSFWVHATSGTIGFDLTSADSPPWMSSYYMWMPPNYSFGN